MTPEELVDSPDAVVHMVDMVLPHEKRTCQLGSEQRRAGNDMIFVL
jgi:hypothetical protein